MTKLNQVLAAEKGIKDRVHKELSTLHKLDQKPTLFNGMSRVYAKKSDDGEDFPAEGTKVQMIAEDVLQRVSVLMTELIDITAAKDTANCNAIGTLTIGGQIYSLPVTQLLFLESKLVDMKDIVDKMPTLDSADDWTFDQNSKLAKSAPSQTSKTKKVQKALVLLQSTGKHPGQAVQITEDEIVGFWTTIKMSGALPLPRKQQLLERIEKMITAVKQSREQANLVDAPDMKIGQALFQQLLS
jgi:hypothetical protein